MREPHGDRRLGALYSRKKLAGPGLEAHLHYALRPLHAKANSQVQEKAFCEFLRWPLGGWSK